MWNRHGNTIITGRYELHFILCISSIIILIYHIESLIIKQFNVAVVLFNLNTRRHDGFSNEVAFYGGFKNFSGRSPRRRLEGDSWPSLNDTMHIRITHVLAICCFDFKHIYMLYNNTLIHWDLAEAVCFVALRSPLLALGKSALLREQKRCRGHKNTESVSFGLNK
jgi:hypothetical protein